MVKCIQRRVAGLASELAVYPSVMLGANPHERVLQHLRAGQPHLERL